MTHMIFEPSSTEEVLVQHAQDLIMSRGYISAMELAMELTKHLYRMGDEGENINVPKLIDMGIVDDKNFHKVEYTNGAAAYRVKDLFYYKPKNYGRKKRKK